MQNFNYLAIVLNVMIEIVSRLIAVNPARLDTSHIPPFTDPLELKLRDILVLLENGLNDANASTADAPDGDGHAPH